MGEPLDAEWMQRWQAGDATAFEALVRRWQQPIARYVFRLVGPAGPVADLCQEIFLRVYSSGQSYRETNLFSAWLYRIALNVVRDHERRSRPTLPLQSTDALDRQPGADQQCQQRELALLMAQAVALLPEPERMVVALHHDEGLSFAEIARRTGISPNTWKSRYATALSRLRDLLAQRGYPLEENAP